MARKKQEISVGFFTADGVEVGNILDLAGPYKDELVMRIVDSMARDAARRDHLAEIGRQSNGQHGPLTQSADSTEGGVRWRLAEGVLAGI